MQTFDEVIECFDLLWNFSERLRDYKKWFNDGQITLSIFMIHHNKQVIPLNSFFSEHVKFTSIKYTGLWCIHLLHSCIRARMWQVNWTVRGWTCFHLSFSTYLWHITYQVKLKEDIKLGNRAITTFVKQTFIFCHILEIFHCSGI